RPASRLSTSVSTVATQAAPSVDPEHSGLSALGAAAASHLLSISAAAFVVFLPMQSDAFMSDGGGVQLPAATLPLCSSDRHLLRHLSFFAAKLLRVFATVSAHFASAALRPSGLAESPQ